MKKSCRLKILFLLSFSCALGVPAFAASGTTQEETYKVKCSPRLVSTAVNLLTREIKNKVSALSGTSGTAPNTTTISYYALPKIKVSYAGSDSKKTVKLSDLLPGASISASSNSEGITVNVSGAASLANKCPAATAVLKIGGSVRKSVTTKTATDSTFTRSTIALTGPDIEVRDVLQAH